MTVLAIDDVLYDAFDQRQMATMFTQLDQNHVILVLDPSRQTSTATLEHLFFRASSGPLVPLNMLVSVKAEQVPIIINHRGVFPAITLSFDLAPGHAYNEAVSVINQASPAVAMPDTVSGSFQGTVQALRIR